MARAILVGTTEGLLILERQNGDFNVRCRHFEGTAINALSSDPRCGTVYAGAAKSLFKSGDGGESWREVDGCHWRSAKNGFSTPCPGTGLT